MTLFAEGSEGNIECRGEGGVQCRGEGRIRVSVAPTTPILIYSFLRPSTFLSLSLTTTTHVRSLTLIGFWLLTLYRHTFTYQQQQSSTTSCLCAALPGRCWRPTGSCAFGRSRLWREATSWSTGLPRGGLRSARTALHRRVRVLR
jgi:hypothetical protein